MIINMCTIYSYIYSSRTNAFYHYIDLKKNEYYSKHPLFSILIKDFLFVNFLLAVFTFKVVQ